MILNYGLSSVTLTASTKPKKITIKYRGGMLLRSINRNYRVVRKRNIIIMIPNNDNFITEDILLFKYNGEFRIISCNIGNRSVKVKNKYIDTWNKITTKWEDMTLEWEDYLMDYKINTEKKRLEKKRINQNEL